MNRYACRICAAPSATATCARCQPKPKRRTKDRHTGSRPYRQARAAVLERDHHTCAYCGGPAGEVDHHTPIALGGTNSTTNLVACCRACNRRKGAHAA